MNPDTDSGEIMNAIRDQDSVRGWSVLERGDAQESRESEAALLSVTWRSLPSWSAPIRRRPMPDPSCRRAQRELTPQQNEAEPHLLTLARQ